MSESATPVPRRDPGSGTTVLLVRLSPEITTKARATRLRFMRKLADNIHAALAASGARFEIERQWSRIVVTVDHPEAPSTVSRVFGVHSVSVAVARPWTDLEDIVAQGRERFRSRVAGRRFAVRAHRVDPGDGIPFGSTDVERELGAALLEFAAGVDLTAPEYTARVEVHPDRVFLFDGVVPAHGGLPLGVDSRALSLVSGGFDSAVASWSLLRRGVALDYLFFNLGGTIHHLGTSRVLRVLARDWSHGYDPRLYVVDLRHAVDDLRQRAPSRYWQVLLKRMMVRGAERLASEIGAPALVMGDAVGQVSSQTLDNLAVISQATSRPILRPLIAANKQEIVDRARAIGTFELSAAVGEYCALQSKRSTTRAALDGILALERELDESLFAEALTAGKRFDLRSPQPVEEEIAHLGVDTVPGDAVVVDLRSRDAFDRWHYRDAVRLSYETAIRNADALPAAKRYVFYCEVGLKSAHVAELLAGRGIAAHYFEGGAADLRRAELDDDPLADAIRAPAARTD